MFNAFQTLKLHYHCRLLMHVAQTGNVHIVPYKISYRKLLRKQTYLIIDGGLSVEQMNCVT